MMVASCELRVASCELKTFFHIREPGPSSNNIQRRTVVLLGKTYKNWYSIEILNRQLRDQFNYIFSNQQVWLDLFLDLFSGLVSTFYFLHFAHYTKMNSNWNRQSQNNLNYVYLFNLDGLNACFCITSWICRIADECRSNKV